MIRNLDILTIEHTGFGDNEFRREFKDEKIKSDFSEYHLNVAKLRLIDRNVNLKLK